MATRAFTMVEVLAGALVFVLGTVAVIGVIAYGLTAANRAQADATAWATACSVLKDPLPLGGNADEKTGVLVPWTWTRAGDTWTAKDETGFEAWTCTTWQPDRAGDVLVPDMANPQPGNPAVFPAVGAPAAGCGRGWLNGYFVERREQSRASDRIGQHMRIVEVRVDVYWAGYQQADARPLATVIDRVVRQGGL